MKVNDLIEQLKKCDPTADVYYGRPCHDVEDVEHVTEIGYSDEYEPSVHLYSDDTIPI